MISKKLIFVTFVAICLFSSCGGGGGGGGGDDSTGSEINEAWTIAELDCNGTVTGGTFSSGGASVSVADGEMSTCVNATEDPTIEATDTLPDGLDIRTTEGDQNVTKGGDGYTFDIHGDMGFSINTEGAVTITLPFTPTGAHTSLNTFVRVFNADDSSLVDIAGVVTDGSITIETMGLPQNFTAVVIYNPNMTALSTVEPAPAIVLKTLTSLPPWPNRSWCVILNPASQEVINAVKIYKGVANPSLDDIKSAMNEAITNVLPTVKTVYEAANFRAPNLFLASKATDDPCPELTTTPRYNVHVIGNGSKFVANDPSEVVSPTGNRYGRIYIAPKNINVLHDFHSKAVIAHEMLHAIQNGYELYGDTAKGYREGTATTYGVTIESGEIVVRSYSTGETMLLSDFLATNKRGTSLIGAYANQDFFAYVGRAYNGESLAYLSGLFDKMHTDIAAQMAADPAKAAAIKQQPPRALLLNSMDSYFQSGLATTETLTNIYLDFLKQRALDHNTESFFDRADETILGFASNLFQTNTKGALNSIGAVTVNADNCSMGGETGGFGNVAPYAARAIQIITGTTKTDGVKITVELKPASGTVGEKWSGFSSREGGAAQVVGATNEFTGFGKTSSDEIVIVLANITKDTVTSFEYEVTCEANGGGGGESTFSLTNFTLENQLIAPAYVLVAPPLHIGSSYIAATIAESTFDESAWATENYLLFEFHNTNITGPGTYNLTPRCYVESEGTVSAIFSPSQTAAEQSVYCTYSGTVTLTEFGINAGDHITGSMEITMQTFTPTEKYGNISATFDFVVDTTNPL